MIDGQPKRGDFWRDGDDRPVFSCRLQTKDDALQAHGMVKLHDSTHWLIVASPASLAGRNWYDFAAGGRNCDPSMMKIACYETRPGERRLIAGPTNVPVDANAARSSSRSTGDRNGATTSAHRRASSTSSNTQISLSPVAPNYGLRHAMIAGMAPRMAHVDHAAAASRPPYPQNMVVGRSVFEPGPARYSVQRREVIIQNLRREVTENMLMQRLSEAVGRVESCRIERREERKCHAFVTFAQAVHAEKAVHDLHRRTLFDREVTVRLTKEGERGPIIADGSS